MIIDNKLIIEGLKKVRLEKKVQSKILESIDKHNYSFASYLIDYYDKLCEETDNICRELIKQTPEENLFELRETVEDIACERYGGNCSEGVSLSLIASNIHMKDLIDGEVIESDTFTEETSYDIHSFITDKYLNSKDGKYKKEMLEHLNNNISNSISLRELFRGHKEEYDKYNPDLYYNFIEAKINGEDMIRARYITSCITLDELNKFGFKHLYGMGFSREDAIDILNAQKDVEKMKIASYYIIAVKRLFDIRININEFSKKTREDIEEASVMADKTLRKEYKNKPKIKVLII